MGAARERAFVGGAGRRGPPPKVVARTTRASAAANHGALNTRTVVWIHLHCWQSRDVEVPCRHVTTATQPRGVEDSKLAIIVLMTGAVTLMACITWAISRSSGLSNVSGEDFIVAPLVVMVGLVPFVVLAFGAVMLGRAITMVATTVFALVIVAAYLPSLDSSTAIGHPIRASTTLLVVAAFALVGLSEGVRAMRRHRTPA